ncbi:phage tail protein [Erwinia tracheiphila]|uniref:Phage tail protein n=1 Tax=Erwinia tracheiphila TaxID=65700 RepID=A0A345CPG3_9GAMM|nr:phage tail protein [Erwinia tracheiphila]AXF75330.1 phage tail protein [Erwinia tracheiphila]UIA82123.1 phage tail protein [Erwinia tracheiphila]UIA90719.1 phage tail protein [Erwinia tracheiphila]
MTQLDDLYRFVHEALPDRLMETTGADAWMDDIELINAAKAWGLNQRRIWVRRYNATLAWERWPYRQYAPDVLFALIGVWLNEHANEHYNQLELAPPAVFVELMDNGNAVITITVPLADDVIIAEDAENGVIPMKDKRWSVVSGGVDIAERGWLYGTGGIGAPVGDSEH